MLVTGAPVAIPDEATDASTLGLGSSGETAGRSGDDDTLGKLLGDPTLTVIAIPVIDSSTLTHCQHDRDYSAIAQSMKISIRRKSPAGRSPRAAWGRAVS